MTVYCARRKGDGPSQPIKFGFTNDIRQRMRALNQQTPEGVTLIAAIPGGRELEAFILRLLRHDVLAGEWMAPSSHVDNIIGIMCEMAERRSGQLGDLPEQPDPEPGPIPVSTGGHLNRVLRHASDLKAMPPVEAQELHGLSWDERHRIAVGLREWGADAAEWIMPELRMGRDNTD